MNGKFCIENITKKKRDVMANKKKTQKQKTAKKTVKKPMKKKTTAKKITVKSVKKNSKNAVAKKAVPKKAKAKVAPKLAKKTSTKTTKIAAKSKAAGKSNSAVKVAIIKPLVTAKPVKNIDYTKAITPLQDRLVVRLVSNERITAGGLIIPETASMAAGYLKAEVLAVGNGLKSKKGNLRPLDVKIGDQVLFSEYAGAKIQFNSEDLQIIHESDVMGILQG